MAIYYLDADDEITSAATRIRDSSDNRIALVLTAGSRVATSRINFLLLAREARKRNKRLAIVTSDLSTQSVARSAELAVYGTVGEYERAEAARTGQGAVAPPAGAGAMATGVQTSAALGELARTVSAPPRGPAGSPSRTTASSSSGRIRVPWPAVAAAFAIAIVLVAGSLFFVYPSATVTVTLAEQPIGPLDLKVTVDPNANSVNDQTTTVPGLNKAFPVEANGTYTATGEKVEEAPATGTVTFTSFNTIFAVPVIAGTQVLTASGIAFTTQQTVTVPKAPFAVKTQVSVPVTAVKPGTSGNVDANTIVRLPSDLANANVSVTNPQPTTGGTHTVSPQVAQTDVQSAEADLLNQLEASFQAALADPSSHPAGSSLFDQTARMGVEVCSPDPAGLVGLVQDTFELTCSATGTATVASMTDVKSLAERRISSLVTAGYSLVSGSVQTQLGDPAVDAGSLTVPLRPLPRRSAR